MSVVRGEIVDEEDRLMVAAVADLDAMTRERDELRAALTAMVEAAVGYFNKRGAAHANHAGNEDVAALAEALANTGPIAARAAGEEHAMYPVFVSARLPSVDLAQRFFMWLANGGGEEAFAAHLAESSDPVVLEFDYATGVASLTIRVTLAPEEPAP
jgi:hypothetical protein